MTRKSSWIANYVYADDRGIGRMKTLKIQASTMAEAKILAVQYAPKAEYILTVQPETEEQFLNQVRHQAHRMSRNSDGNFDPD